VGWGYYKLIPIQDDYSRKIIAYDVRPGETAFSISDIMKMGIENARKEGHLVATMPKLYTDYGPGFSFRSSQSIPASDYVSRIDISWGIAFFRFAEESCRPLWLQSTDSPRA